MDTRLLGGRAGNKETKDYADIQPVIARHSDDRPRGLRLQSSAGAAADAISFEHHDGNTPRPAASAAAARHATAVGPLGRLQADFAVKATDRVYFDYDAYNLDSDDQRSLSSQIAWLKQFPSTRVEVQGHADERGTRDYNIALGERRAQSVKSFLVAQGIAEGRIQTISFGKDKPLDPGHDEAAWSRNRNAYTNVIVEAIS